MIHRWRMERELAELADGDLPEPRRTRLLRHLEECPACADTLRQLRETDHLLMVTCPAPSVVPPDRDRATFRKAVAASGILRRSPYRLRWGIALTATVAAAILVGRAAGVRPQPAPAVAKVPDTQDGRQDWGGPHSALSLFCSSTQAAASVPAGNTAPTLRLAAAVTSRRYPARAGRGRVFRKRSHPLPAAVQFASRRPARDPAPAPVLKPVLEVKLTSGTPAPMLEVTTREVAPETPGYARAGAWRQSANGSLIWTQATVDTERPAPELVLLPSLSCD